MKIFSRALKAFGIDDGHGALSFTKCVVLLCLAVKPPALLGIGCIAGAFGKSVFSKFLAKPVAVTEGEN